MKLFDLEKLIDTFTGFLETKIELIKLDAREELTGLVAKALVFFVLMLLGLMAMIFLSFGLSTVLNVYLESRYLGYLIVGVIYLGLCGLIYAQRTVLLERIRAEANKEVSEEE